MEPTADLPTGHETSEEQAAVGERDSRARPGGACFYQGLVEAMPALVWVCDRVGHVEFVNRRWQEYTGLSMRAVNHDGFETVVHPDDRPRLREAWREALLSGTGFTAGFRYRSRDGSYRWFQGSASPAPDPGRGMPKWLFVLHAPIPGLGVSEYAPCPGSTGRCMASETLARASERMDMVLDAAGAGLWDWDPITGRVEWSFQLYRLFGLDPGLVVPSFASWRKAVHPDDRERAALQVDLALRERTFLADEYRVVRPDGQVRWINVLGQGTYDERGRAIRMSAICLDVTARKAAEDAVRLSEEKFSALFFGNSALMTLTRMWDGRLVEVNQKALERFGFTRHEAVGKTTPDLMVYRNPEDRLQAVCDLQQHGRFTDREIEFVSRQGEVWVALMSSEVIQLRGESFVLSSLWDITSRKEAERAVQALNVELEALVRELRESNDDLRDAREVAESASRMKSEFLAMMSHEIRTPLNGVMGMQSLLLESDLPPAEREMATLAQTSAKALLLVLSDILDLSRIEAERLVLEPAPFDMFRLVREATALQAATAHDRGLDLLVDAPPDSSCLVMGDSGRLRQVLINLVGNAVKFTHVGQVRVSVEATPVNGGAVAFVVRVADTGIGIPPPHLDVIFSPFIQVDSGLTRRYGGSGLGLALCRKLLAMMDGTLSVTSQVGEGSCFVVELTLPAAVEVPREATQAPVAAGPRPVGAPREATQAPVAAGPSPVGAPREATQAPVAAGPGPIEPGRPRAPRVLLVEDNHLNQTITAALLQRLGCTVDVACNGLEAVQMVASREYGLVFMDCQMPVMDGFEATAEIRRRNGPNSRVPVVAVTAHVLEGDRQRCLDAGMDDYLAKPLEVSQMEAALERWLWSRLAAGAPSPG